MDTSTNTNNTQFKNLNFGYAFRPVLHFIRVVGLWPFSILRNSHGSIQKSRVRPIDVVWFLGSICFYLTALYYTAAWNIDQKYGKIFLIFLQNSFNFFSENRRSL